MLSANSEAWNMRSDFFGIRTKTQGMPCVFYVRCGVSAVRGQIGAHPALRRTPQKVQLLQELQQPQLLQPLLQQAL